MSGGSYNYLYSHVKGLEAQREDIEAMRDRLQGLEAERIPGAAFAARQTRMVLNHLKLAEEHAQRLAEVWQAVEWVDSGNWHEADLGQALEDYKERWCP